MNGSADLLILVVVTLFCNVITVVLELIFDCEGGGGGCGGDGDDTTNVDVGL